MKKPRGVRYVSDTTFSWTRSVKQGRSVYVTKGGRVLKESDQERIKSLAIPPAWTDVRVSPDPQSHIQAVGVDVRGRKQYIYHQQWIEYNQKNKFDSLQRFGEVLPTLRETVAGHMRQHSLSRERILATMVWLLEHTFIRVGNKAYAKENQSYGLTTLRNKHLDIEGNTLTFSFKGKSNVYHQLSIKHPRVVSTIKKCIELPGYQVFQYLDDQGTRHSIDSADINRYLKEISGDDLSAKDFRTWGGTTLAGNTLYQLSTSEEELPVDRALVQAVKQVSRHLGNTVPVCRKYYIHPKVIKKHEQHTLVPHFQELAKEKEAVPDGLSWEEYATLSLLSK